MTTDIVDQLTLSA